MNYSIVFVSIFMLFVQKSFQYDKRITCNNYSSCKKQFYFIGQPSGKNPPDHTNFIPISSLVHGVTSDTVRVRFYFQGKSDFHVMFSRINALPKPNEKVFDVCKFIKFWITLLKKMLSWKSRIPLQHSFDHDEYWSR